jgi:hypothetical protein
VLVSSALPAQRISKLPDSAAWCTGSGSYILIGAFIPARMLMFGPGVTLRESQSIGQGREGDAPAP